MFEHKTITKQIFLFFLHGLLYSGIEIYQNTKVSEKDCFPLVTNACPGAGGRRGGIQIMYYIFSNF